MDASEREAKLLQEMRYIAGISTGQVKRVADAALASMVAPTPSARTDELALAASGEIMGVMYGAMPPGGSVQLQAMVQCIVQRAIDAGNQRQPLTDDRIDEIMNPLTKNVPYSWRLFARAIETEVNSPAITLSS